MKKNWPIFALAFVLIAIIGVSCYANPSDEEQKVNASNNAQPSGISQPHPSQTSQGAQQYERSPVWRRILTWPDGDTALAIFLTLFFIAWQALLTRQAIASSDKASKVELRAYVIVSINTACYQDRPKDIKFEGTPTITNTGKTPAHNVRYRNNVAILREPLDKNYVFAPGQSEIGEYVLGMNEDKVMHIVMDDYCDQNDVKDIMDGTKGRALYYWGKVIYDDAFGDTHWTEFCHRIFFVPDPNNPGTFKVHGHYIPGRNKAT